MAGRPLNVLVVSTFDGSNANVIRDYLFSFNAHSRHRYYYIFNPRILDTRTDFAAFDVIMIFWSVYLPGPELTDAVRERIGAAPTVKVLFLQDEFRDVRPINEVMCQLGIQLMFTCVAKADHETFYPPSLIPTLEATYTVLPGYVPLYLEKLGDVEEISRPIDVGYRSREVPYYLGDLGREKRIIADRFEAICADQSLRSDISIRESDRFYGSAWVSFLRTSRCVLGTASGASVVDFTGDIRRNCERYAGLHPQATYEEVKARFFAEIDWQVVIDTVSPRVFEAAALRCTMVNHEGFYAGILEPDRHYICVKRDYSNIADVVDRIRDHSYCRGLADNAYRDLVGSGCYGYPAFVREFDQRLDRHVAGRRMGGGVSRRAFYLRNYLRHRQAIIPREGGFMVAPSYTLPFDLLRRALNRLPGQRRGPLMSRFIRNPGNFFRRIHAATRIIFATPCLRAMVGLYLRSGRTRGEVPIWQLIDDLLKIDIARRARGGTLRSKQPFGIEVEFDADSSTLRLSSVARFAASAARAALLPDVERAVREGRVRLVMWDHTAVAPDMIYEVRPGWWLQVGLGSGGVHRFEALSAVYRRSPNESARPLLMILGGEERTGRTWQQ